MTNAYFYQSIFTRRLGSGSACRKRTSGSLGNQANIKGSSDLYGVEFPNTIHKISRITKIPSY
jgi:diphosphomevalonate decarboxylase